MRSVIRERKSPPILSVDQTTQPNQTLPQRDVQPNQTPAVPAVSPYHTSTLLLPPFSATQTSSLPPFLPNKTSLSSCPDQKNPTRRVHSRTAPTSLNLLEMKANQNAVFSPNQHCNHQQTDLAHDQMFNESNKPPKSSFFVGLTSGQALSQTIAENKTLNLALSPNQTLKLTLPHQTTGGRRARESRTLKKIQSATEMCLGRLAEAGQVGERGRSEVREPFPSPWEVVEGPQSGGSTPVHAPNTNYRAEWKSVAEIRHFIGREVDLIITDKYDFLYMKKRRKILQNSVDISI